MQNVFDRMERDNSKWKVAMFRVKQKQSYEFKRKYAAVRAIQFVRECDLRNLDYHVSVGGLDSIVLYLFLHSIGITASGVEAVVGRTVAMHQVDMHILGIEYGDRIYIEGIGERVVEDTGCRQGVIDVACESHEECYKVTRYSVVEVLGK